MTDMIKTIKASASANPIGDAIQEERERILRELDKMEEYSHTTRTPIYQETFFEQVRSIVYNVHPPYNFRDKSNGE